MGACAPYATRYQWGHLHEALGVDGGDQFRAGTDRAAPIVTVAAIEDDEVMLDSNHPLAGVDLAFDVMVLNTRAATAEELTHGHAQGDDGQERGE